jgi:hypothetical protein
LLLLFVATAVTHVLVVMVPSMATMPFVASLFATTVLLLRFQ